MAHEHSAPGSSRPPPGIARRSLLGAGVTSVLAGSAVARMLQRLGPEALDGSALVVAQHELRTDRVRAADLRWSNRRDGGVEPFVLVGISAPGGLPADEEHTAWVRTRGSDGWSEWMPLVFSPWERPDGAEGNRGPALTSQALWVGSSDAIELELPTGLERSAAVTLLRETPRVLGYHGNLGYDGDQVRVSHSAGGTATRAPLPSIRPRDAWGARDFRGTPSVAPELHMAVVHHTVSRNGYSAAEVPGIIAGIQRYHMDTNGWNDIGYNFVVDRFGQAWEARAGGIDQAVIGGHAFAHNTGSTGIALLGDHQASRPSAEAVQSVAALAAWKLDLHGRDVADAPFTYESPAGFSASYPRIIGHRDAGATSGRPTACPGQHLFAEMGEVRASAHMRQVQMSDIPLWSIYAASVAWMLRAGITTGIGSPPLFRPADIVTRGQMALFLWRLMGEPAEVMPHGFVDVPPGSIYDEAVRWLRASGVTAGSARPGHFEPQAPVTRAQMVTFLWRLAGEPGGNPDHGFGDVPPGSFFEEAVRWARSHGITGGTSEGRFEPGLGVSRGQTALFMWRLARRAAAWAPGTETPPHAQF